MRVVGLDLSLTSSGIADDEGTHLIRTKTTGIERLRLIRESVLAHTARGIAANLVVIEGYSFASRFKGEFMGELGGVVKVALWEAGIPFAVVQPALLKTYATGKGNAPKEAMLAAAIRRLGYGGDSHDEADACWLYAMGRDWLGEPFRPMPEAHRKALAKVEWPDLAVVLS
jgi:Holliday junction resolvasome RuvABC endonuclease subunit